MHKLFILVFTTTLLSCHSFKGKPELKLSTYIYNLGNIHKDSVYRGNIILTNSGNAPLIIEDIDSGCGCTSVNITKNTIPPKDTCLLDFSYNTRNKKGIQENFITIIDNTDSLIHVLQINAYVY